MSFILQTILLILLIAFSYKFLISTFVSQIRKEKKLSRIGIKVEGRIIDNQESLNTDGGKKYSPIIEYFINDISYHILWLFPKFRPNIVGDKVEVLCNPEDPQDAIINKPSLLPAAYFMFFFWLAIVVLLILGLIYGSSSYSGPLWP